MLTISQNVPPQVVIGSETQMLGAGIAETGGIWFHADPDHVMLSGRAIAAWRAMDGARQAVPTQPNAGGSSFDPRHSGFVFQTGLHCGFTLAGAVPRITRFSVAVVFTSPLGEARSLFALNTGAANAMIFLSQAGGRIFAQDRGGALAVDVPTPPRPDAKQLVILSYENRCLSLWADGVLAQCTGRPEGLDAPADLFIGCRSHRPGLVKTLGASLIHEVMFWPDRAIWTQDLAMVAMVQRFHRWTA